ncbi:Methanethiol S-methyltransferase [Methylobacterium crusticola]|uniref:methanethiol S-methyltransferase n=1 Tax=Methylobacterium crusticola TaxID=1697972 RepID=A0ABQ4R9X4_9HYPH|nr:methanethiol S-methyltransferase [Methylobacterium crusticola]GJD53904.1 Methanethiol S-methyltransferase [Methylobacterium crusticola]
MLRLAALLYGAFAYLVFFATFLYAVGFLGQVAVPKAIDDGAVGSVAVAVVVDVALLTLFALQHSVMARPAFKRWWTRFVPAVVERSTFVLFASLVLALLFWQWRPLPQAVWTVTDPAGATLVTGLFWLGWLIVLASTFMISHFELFGLTQVYAAWRQRAVAETGFVTPFLYRYVRHPIYLGFIVAFWAAATMSAGHLLFAGVATLYILVGIRLEERDLLALLGQRYARYRAEVGMLMPRLRIGRSAVRDERTLRG